MKERFFLHCFFVATVSILSACNDDLESSIDQHYREDQLLILEAKASFKNQVMAMATMNSTGDQLKGLATDFTPLWSQSVICRTENSTIVNVPIAANFEFRAITNYSMNGEQIPVSVEVHQQLVVTKDVETGNMYSCMMTTIPDVEYYLAIGQTRNLLCGGNYGNFSGKILYTPPLYPNILIIYRYENGILVDEAFCPYVEEDEQQKEYFVEKLNMMFSGIAFQKKSRLATRADGKETHGMGIVLEEVVIVGVDKSKYLDPDPMIEQIFADLAITMHNSLSKYAGNTGGTGSPGGPGESNSSNNNKNNSNASSSKPNKSLKSTTKFVGYGTDDVTNCLDLCKKILTLHGQTNPGDSQHVYQLLVEEGTLPNRILVRFGNDPTENYKNAILCIDRHLDNNKVIIVGINRKTGLNINDGATDHFVVINGRGFDAATKLYYYTYYEVATSDSNKGCQESNKFIYDPSGPSFYNPKSSHYEDTQIDVTQVRPNDGTTGGTIAQPKKQ